MEMPIDMICVCGSDGDIRPLRFRFPGSDRELKTAAITQVISSKSIQYVGIEGIDFLCMAKIGAQESTCILRYLLRSHSWTLIQTAPPSKRTYRTF